MGHQCIVGVTIRSSSEVDCSIKYWVRVVAILTFCIDSLICAVYQLGKLIKGSSIREGLIKANTAHVTQGVRHLSYLCIHDVNKFLHWLEIVTTTHEVTHNVRSATFCIAVLVRKFIEVFQLDV